MVQPTQICKYLLKLSAYLISTKISSVIPFYRNTVHLFCDRLNMHFHQLQIFMSDYRHYNTFLTTENSCLPCAVYGHRLILISSCFGSIFYASEAISWVIANMKASEIRSSSISMWMALPYRHCQGAYTSTLHLSPCQQTWQEGTVKSVARVLAAKSSSSGPATLFL